ncbi:hypothetical protein RHSIM_Rhsim04G0214300 [Rhododendron simsii]|uniref:CHCH domain-containing protein n=1 Tax=Rhododendron simsii TaxID=118357 RepID=A0A834LRL4_RHOSS|nr:hypothetical protein RHSIM_Rhsim04G0214300 [Rhododendron simsii]
MSSSSAVDPEGEPIPTSAVLMASAKHISTRCRAENVAFLKCKKDDPNPEKCLDKGQQVTRCVLSLSGEVMVVIQKDEENQPGLGVGGEGFEMPHGTPLPVLPTSGDSKLNVSAEYWLEDVDMIDRGKRLKDLHQSCTKEMDAYVGCMYYHTNEFELCRKEQKEFEKACPLE